MSESASEATNAGAVRPEAGNVGPDGKKRSFFARVVIFVRQVIAELKKVVTPTRSELMTYTLVVIAFVAVVMVFITIIDFGIGKVVLWMFG